MFRHLYVVRIRHWEVGVTFNSHFRQFDHFYFAAVFVHHFRPLFGEAQADTPLVFALVVGRFSDDMQMALVATPEYLAKNDTPQTLQDLTQHQCVCVRMPTSEGLFVWEFRSPDSQEIIKFTPNGRLVVNNNFLAKKACLSHLGLALMPKDRMAKELERGEVVELLPEYAMHYDGYHLYYSNRRQNSPLFKALVECLR